MLQAKWGYAIACFDFAEPKTLFYAAFIHVSESPKYNNKATKMYKPLTDLTLFCF